MVGLCIGGLVAALAREEEADAEVDRESAETGQGDDLERETGDSDVDGDLGGAAGGGGEPATGALKGEGDDVAGNEDVVVEFGVKASDGQSRVEVVCYFCECEVDACGEEDRCESDAYDLDHKSSKGERIVVEHDATTIADQFSNVATEHGTSESPGPPSKALI